MLYRSLLHLYVTYEQLRFDILLHLYFILHILHLDATYNSKASDLISLCLLLIRKSCIFYEIIIINL